MIILYTVGGIIGFFVSALAGVRFTIGASAAICSLIGSLLYYAKSRGGVYGQNLFSQIGGWALGIGLFGFMVPGINNWGHGGGMVAGLLLGYLLGYKEKHKDVFAHKIMAAICLIGTCLAIAWSCFNGSLFVIFTYL